MLTSTLTNPPSCTGVMHCICVDDTKLAGTTCIPNLHDINESILIIDVGDACPVAVMVVNRDVDTTEAEELVLAE